MTRVLVTGASGFIGRHVVDAALRRGWDVVALVRDAGAHHRRTAGELCRERVAVAEGDVRDAASVRAAMEGCSIVMHVAGVYSFDPADAGLMRDVNVGGSANVLREAAASGVERVVYTGSVSSTAFHDDRLATERDIAGPEEMRGPYKRSKFEAERLVRRKAAQGAPVVIVCPTAVIGPGDAKPTPTGRIVLDFMRGRFPAYLDTGLNFVHVRDVAEGHVLAAERGAPGARYLLGAVDGNLTLAEAFDILASLAGRRAPRVRLPYPAALAASWASVAAGKALRRSPLIPPEAVRTAARRMWVDPSWSVRELALPQTPVVQAFREAVDWYARHLSTGRRRVID